MNFTVIVVPSIEITGSLSFSLSRNETPIRRADERERERDQVIYAGSIKANITKSAENNGC